LDFSIEEVPDLPLPSLVALAVEGAFDFDSPSEVPFDCPSALDFDGLSTTAGARVGDGAEGEGSAGGAVGMETGTDAAGCGAAGLDCVPGDTATV
jgi:hypothetical protein